jgi:methionyl-tRNA formyltransferase
MAGSLRVVLLSHGAAEFGILHNACVDFGADPVAYVAARSQRTQGSTTPAAVAVIADLLPAVPAATDLLLPASATALVDALAGYAPDLLLSYCYPWRLPKSVLAVPRLGAINVHSSLLPRYRGPIPVHWAVRNGDTETGVTAHWMDEKFDSGPILAQHGGVAIPADAIADDLFATIADVIPGLLARALARAIRGFAGVRQNEVDACYAGWMEPEFATIDWSWRVDEIHNQVRTFRFATAGALGPVATIDGEFVEVLRTHTRPTDGVRVHCADGPLWLVDVRPAGNSAGRWSMPWIARAPSQQVDAPLEVGQERLGSCPVDNWFAEAGGNIDA